MNIKDIEKEIYTEIQNLFSAYKDDLFKKNISYDIQLKTESNFDITLYCSEVEINFYRDGHFFDIIEFFIYRDGKLYINRETIISDLKSNVKDIINSVP